MQKRVINSKKPTTIVETLNRAKVHKQFRVGKGAHATIVLIAHKATDATIEVVLAGSDSSVYILGVVASKKDAMVNLTTVQHHKAPRTMSDLFIKSVLQGSAQFHYEGMIRVEKKAQQTNAYQRNDNLLLSKKAIAVTKPALEILANDVRCTHGATVGQVDAEQLFYLQSRGIKRAAAKQLIVSGFLTAVFDRIEDESVREQVIKKTADIL